MVEPLAVPSKWGDGVRTLTALPIAPVSESHRLARLFNPFVTTRPPLSKYPPVSAPQPSFQVKPTKIGLRLSQHGVVLSELRTTPGPTHSVFDVLAASLAVLAADRRIGVLGFAGGGMLAPLRGLGVEVPVETVDLERTGYELFREHCRAWAGTVNWRQADAVDWLCQQPATFGALVDDLSMPLNGDVIKPVITWEVLPKLIRDRLAPGGAGIFNLLTPPGGAWNPALARIARLFKSAHLIDLAEYENRILIAGDELPGAREFGVRLRLALRRVRSRHATRIQLRNLK
jgi:hypothetical protein